MNMACFQLCSDYLKVRDYNIARAQLLWQTDVVELYITQSES